jgi:nitrite reductase/ring-hydroxylating ferredoxin subunit/uncharacterized membrane protein
MRTRASIKSHPIHAMLIPFPIAFFAGAFFFDLVGWFTGREALWTTGGHLIAAGVITGLLAAVPGVVDYFGSVPPESSAKKRATKHGLVNIVAVAIFGAIWWLRLDPAAPPGLGILLGEAVGLVLLSMGGWMGGTLVHRNFIGPDHRYPESGKWSEAWVRAGDGPITVATADELQVNQMKLVHVGERRVVVGRTEEGWAAFDDRCTHRGGSLAGGVLICGTVQCFWHGSQFDVSTGEPKAGPAKRKLETYPVEVVDGQVRVRLS